MVNAKYKFCAFVPLFCLLRIKASLHNPCHRKIFIKVGPMESCTITDNFNIHQLFFCGIMQFSIQVNWKLYVPSIRKQ